MQRLPSPDPAGTNLRNPAGSLSRPVADAGRRVQRGVILLETLVAFVVLVLSLVVLLQIIANGARAAAVTAHYERALLIAETQLALALHEQPALPQASGRAGGYDWQLRTRPYRPPPQEDAALPQGAPGLEQVTVAVSWGEHAQRREVQLDTLRLARAGEQQR